MASNSAVRDFLDLWDSGSYSQAQLDEAIQRLREDEGGFEETYPFVPDDVRAQETAETEEAETEEEDD